jgi:hypothetical protein
MFDVTNANIPVSSTAVFNIQKNTVMKIPELLSANMFLPAESLLPYIRKEFWKLMRENKDRREYYTKKIPARKR